MDESDTPKESAGINKLKTIVRTGIHVSCGALAGAILAYVLFGLIWTNWDESESHSELKTDRRQGDPVDNWAKGVAGMLLALPVVSTGFVGGGVVGFRLARRRNSSNLDESVETTLRDGINRKPNA